MSTPDELDDDLLDARLRDVAPPVGLRGRFGEISLDDEELHRRLRDVSIPFGLKYRLRRIAAGPLITPRRLMAGGGGRARWPSARRSRRWSAASSTCSSIRIPNRRLARRRSLAVAGTRATGRRSCRRRRRSSPFVRVVAGSDEDVAVSVGRLSTRRFESGSAQVTLPRIAPTDRLLLAAATGRRRSFKPTFAAPRRRSTICPTSAAPCCTRPRGVEAALNAQATRPTC